MVEPSLFTSNDTILSTTSDNRNSGAIWLVTAIAILGSETGLLREHVTSFTETWQSSKQVRVDSLLRCLASAGNNGQQEVSQKYFVGDEDYHKHVNYLNLLRLSLAAQWNVSIVLFPSMKRNHQINVIHNASTGVKRITSTRKIWCLSSALTLVVTSAQSNIGSVATTDQAWRIRSAAPKSTRCGCATNTIRN